MDQGKDRHVLFSIARRMSVLLAFELMLAIGIAYYLSFYITLTFHWWSPFAGGLWTCIAVVIVLNPKIKQAGKTALLYLLGSLIAGVICFILALLAGYHIWTFWLAIFVTVIAVSSINMTVSFRMACPTVIIIMVLGLLNPEFKPWVNALSRFVQAIIGILVAVAFSSIFYPIREKLGLMRDK